MQKRLLASLFAIALGVAMCSSQAMADEVTVAGTASGYFNNNQASLDGLSYLGSNFNVTTVGGFAGLTAGAATPNQNNLGSMTLTGAPASYFGDQFDLTVTFSKPVVIQGSNTATSTANLYGDVENQVGGSVLIHFTSAPVTFYFANDTDSGQFTFSVNDLTLSANQTLAFQGNIFAASQTPISAPEPSALLLLGTGVSGLFAFRKRIAL
jgi:hypothetical protein